MNGSTTGDNGMAKVAILKIPDDIPTLTAVGRIALRHSQLDRLIRLTLKHSGQEGYTDTTTGKMRVNFSKSLKALKKLVKEKATTEQPLNELRALLDRAKKVTRTRNDLLHSLWAEHDGKMIMDGDEGAGPAPSIAKLTQFYGELTGIVMELNESRLRGDLTKITDRPIKKRREKAPKD
jgi:hypothetical protein